MQRPDDQPWWARHSDSARLPLAANGRVLPLPDGRTLAGPMALSCRPPKGVGATIFRPGLCALLGMIPPRPVRVLAVEKMVYWWWEGDLPGSAVVFRQPRLL